MRISRKLSLLVFAALVTLVLAAAPAVATVIHQQEGSFNGSDAPGGPFSAIGMSSIAVDQSTGNVYVLESELAGFGFGHSAISKFSANGVYAGVQLTGSQTFQGSFSFANYFGARGVSGVAVDDTAGSNKGDVYVADTSHGVVDRFSGSGAFECQITGKTPSSAEEIAHECNSAAGSAPTSGPAGIEPTGLAVDSSGDVYVADEEHKSIDKFGPHGEFLSQITNTQTGSHLTGELGSIALDSTSDIYVTNEGKDVVELNPNGSFSRVTNENGGQGVAVDPDTGHVYVSFQPPVSGSGNSHTNPSRAITEYEPSGTPLDTFAYSEEESTGFPALAVGPSGKVYAGRKQFALATTEVLIFSPDIVIPTVTTQAVSEVEESSAIVHGHVDPDAAHGGGEVEKCQFEYGPTTAYGSTAPCTPGPNYSSPTNVSAKIEGLQPKRIYHFRLDAANSNGIQSYSGDEPFPTAGLPSVDYASAEALQTVTIFRAHIDPWGYDTSCQLQYVTDTGFKTSKWADATTVPCSPEDIGAGFGDVYVKLRVSGLTQASAYHYRFLAENRSGLTGTASSAFETFNIEEVKVEDLKSGQVVNPGNQNYEWRPGEPSTQAGEHPYAVATTIALNKTKIAAIGNGPSQGESGVTGTMVNTKNIETKLPPGLIGNPTALPRCPHLLVTEEMCPPQDQVGLIWIYGSKEKEPSEAERQMNENKQWAWFALPLYNVVPASDVPAEFGAFVEGQAPAWITFNVRTGSDYGITADSLKIISAIALEKVIVVVWGVPASHAHDGKARENGEPQTEVIERHGCGTVPCPDPEPEEKAFLTNPTSCAGPQTASVLLDSWQEPESWLAASTELPGGGFTGCGKLKFEPGLEAQPTTNVADSPTGLHVDLHVPQDVDRQGFEEPGTLATADLKDARVTLPAGMTIDPSSADGLQACSEAQIGYLPQRSAEVGHPQFTPGAAECPDASKIGTVEVDSPDIAHPLPGAVYVAAQDANPFKSLLALYITVYDPQTGVVVKLPGKVALDPVTGQLTTTVDENPQLPFNDFKLDFFAGSRGALTTPLVCGSYAVGSDLTPWSAPEGADATPSSLPFTVSGAPGGGACVSSEAQAPNSPGFTAGTASPVAGSYSPFVLKLSREDGSQRFRALNVTLPPGLTGKIAGIEQCPQAAIEKAQSRGHEGYGALEQSSPSCPSGSAVGIVHVGAGSGAPYYVTGRAYFAGPYEGAPFSLVIVTPAVAGPFDLGTVVVRAGLFINPSTAQVTVRSDPFPSILDGIPLDIRSVAVEMNRHEFVLNPTSCAVMSVSGEEKSTTGSVASLSSRFQAGGCTTLPFAPSFTASTQGKASKAGGASLVVKVNPLPGQANIAKVDLQLPKQLPSRLTTLQKACTEAQFNANPAGCPEGSVIGSAVAHTPILNSPLVGPSYLVSHGGAAFPDVEFVLQGEGVKIVLDGGTQIKNGVTYSHFETVPDAPITSFETILPEGPHSVLGTNVPASAKYSLCGQNLTMPTTITGQNGAVVTQTTKIAVTGCPKTVKKALTRAQKLKAALKVCRTKDKGKTNAKRRQREACEKAAQKRYGPQKNGKKRKTGKSKRGK